MSGNGFRNSSRAELPNAKRRTCGLEMENVSTYLQSFHRSVALARSSAHTGPCAPSWTMPPKSKSVQPVSALCCSYVTTMFWGQNKCLLGTATLGHGPLPTLTTWQTALRNTSESFSPCTVSGPLRNECLFVLAYYYMVCMPQALTSVYTIDLCMCVS